MMGLGTREAEVEVVGSDSCRQKWEYFLQFCQAPEWQRMYEEVCSGFAGAGHSHQGVLLRQAGARLAADPTDRLAILILAVSELQAGRPEQCLQRLEQSPTSIANDALTNRVAGYACLAMTQWLTAKAFFEQAVRIHPHQADVWARLGNLQEAWGQPGPALGYYQRGRFFDDSRHESTLALSRLLVECKKLQAAASVLRVALQRDRRSAVLNSELASTLRRFASRARRRGNGRRSEELLQEALQCQQAAVAADGSSKHRRTLATIAQQSGRFDLAQDVLSAAVAVDPESVDNLTRLACLNVDEGKLELAETQFRRVLDLAPDSATAQFRLSRIKKFTPTAEVAATIEMLRAWVRDEGRPRRQRIQLRFALAKILDDIGQYDQAWEQYDAANHLNPGHSRDDNVWRCIESVEKFATARIQCFDAEFFASRRGWGSESRIPVFVVGMPRSGTTLVEQILSSHREVAGAGELREIDQLLHQVGFDHRRSKGRCYRSRDLAVTREVSEEGIRHAAQCYLKRLSREANHETRRVVDKMPTNFASLGWIACLFPGATVIHCRREPMDVLASSYCQNLNLPFCDLDVLPEYYGQYRRLMAHWESVLPIRVHAVDYEALVSEPEPNIRGLIDACGLSWDPACMDFHHNRRAVRTPSKWQVRQPMYRSSVGAWKRFEHHLTHVHDRIRSIIREQA